MTMFRLWCKVVLDSHLVKDVTITDSSDEKSRTRKILDAIDGICLDFDISQPIWLQSNILEFKRHSKTRFNKDNFIDTVDFDYLEIFVIEEDMQ